MWKFLVKQQKIEILEREILADQQISFVNLKFVFDGDWKKFHKVVQFTQCDETYNRVLGTDGLSCLLPSELHSGAVRMSVFGYDKGDTGKQGVKGDKGDKGDTGERGIQGEKGNTGAKGSKGDTGADGKSAYDVWLAQGNSGTETDFLNSLKGEKGDKGDNGSASVDTEKIEEQLAELTNRDTWWGNFNPVGRSEYPDACDTYYVPQGPKRTFAVIPRIADLENNALSNSPIGLFVPDLSERINNLENSSHTHDNKEFLDDIEKTLISRINVLSASLSAVNREQWNHIYALEETSHTHENMDYLDNLIPKMSSMSSKVLSIEQEHGKRIAKLETSLEDLQTVLDDIVEVTE
ncbi:MAG: collagen-like protein [Ruminococcus sp.]|nr:collagen-like protein [Ruminococcus sp.]